MPSGLIVGDMSRIPRILSSGTLGLNLVISSLKKHSITCVTARTEADLFIAQQPNAVVISRDGDFFLHKNVEKCGKLIIGT